MINQFKKMKKILSIFVLTIFTILSSLQFPVVKAAENQPVAIGRIPGT